eukprot:6173766-Pleurochrysis_carterae.AAC.1
MSLAPPPSPVPPSTRSRACVANQSASPPRNGTSAKRLPPLSVSNGRSNVSGGCSNVSDALAARSNALSPRASTPEIVT